MAGFPSPFGGGGDAGACYDGYDEFVPAHVPEPGASLEGHEVLAGDAHAAFHRVTKDIFDDRGVYDMTFGYNLARLNLDQRHPDSGFRYAEEADDPSVLRAEFTPTTPFCPQSDTLTTGSFRAWNGCSDRHEYGLVRVRVDGMHHRSDEINATLEELEERYRETGTVRSSPDTTRGDSPTERGNDLGDRPGDDGTASRGYDPDSPF